MQEGNPSTSAIASAMCRASHLFVDDDPKIFRDDLALALSGCSNQVDLGNRLRQRYGPIELKFGSDFGEFFAGVLRSAMIVRSRFAEEVMEEALGRGIEQYVILGAGLDSFALRRRDLASLLQVYEIDHPATQQWKRTRISELEIPTPTNLRFVPLDFERQMLTEALSSSDYRAHAPAVFSWLGVTMYLTKDAVRRTLQEVAAMARGSEIVVQYTVPEELVDTRHRQYLAEVRRINSELGEPWLSHFTPDELAGQLQDVGFQRIEHLGPDEAHARYFAGRSDDLPCQTVHRLIRAQTK